VSSRLYAVKAGQDSKLSDASVGQGLVGALHQTCRRL
jgi:hypothetical protein